MTIDSVLCKKQRILICFIILLPVNPIHSLAGAKKATVAAISLVDQRVTASSALDHRVEVPRGSLARVVLLSFKFGLKTVVLYKREEEYRRICWLKD